MAKDGTQRGGARETSGRKARHEANLADNYHEFCGDIAKPADFLLEEGKEAVGIYAEMYRWVASFDCLNIVPQSMIEEYAFLTARHRDCERELRNRGYDASGDKLDPVHKMSVEYYKQASNASFAIRSMVDKAIANAQPANDYEDDMDEFLGAEGL